MSLSNCTSFINRSPNLTCYYLLLVKYINQVFVLKAKCNNCNSYICCSLAISCHTLATHWHGLTSHDNFWCSHAISCHSHVTHWHRLTSHDNFCSSLATICHSHVTIDISLVTQFLLTYLSLVSHLSFHFLSITYCYPLFLLLIAFNKS